MKKLIMIVTVVIFMSASYNGFAFTAREIVEKNENLPEGDTARRNSILLIVKSGKTEKKEFASLSKKYGRRKRSRMSFTYPTKMEFLSWDIPGKDNQQWIKLTSGKVRKIASSEKDKPWMNSHFSYEDVTETYIEDYDYRLLGEEKVNGVQCHKIEAVKKRGKKVYSKTEIFIGKNDYLSYRVCFYENGLHTKILNFLNYENIDGFRTARKLVVERTDGKGKSILYHKTIKYNVPVDDRDLTRESF